MAKTGSKLYPVPNDRDNKLVDATAVEVNSDSLQFLTNITDNDVQAVIEAIDNELGGGSNNHLHPIQNGTFEDKASSAPWFPGWEGNYGYYTLAHSSYISHGTNTLKLIPASNNAYQECEVLAYVPYCLRFKARATGSYAYKISIVVYEQDGTYINPNVAMDSKSSNWEYTSGKEHIFVELTSQSGWYYFNDIIRFKADGNYHANKIRIQFELTGTSGDIRINDIVMYPVKDESSYNAPSEKG